MEITNHKLQITNKLQITMTEIPNNSPNLFRGPSREFAVKKGENNEINHTDNIYDSGCCVYGRSPSYFKI
jgi:hypothetical protein